MLSLGSAFNATQKSLIHPSPVVSQSPGPPTAVISIDPKNITITDPSGKLGSSVTFNVTLSTSPSINLFVVWVEFNTSSLQANPNSISYSGNILGSDGQVQSECVAGAAIQGTCSTSQSFLFAPDVVSLAMYLLGGETTKVSGGLLFRITFTVLSIGFSQLHILSYALENGVKVESYGATTVDGFFTNMKCGSAFCKPPFVDFTISPTEPSIGTVVLFNATSSHATNQDPSTHQIVGIEKYKWFWGGEICHGIASDQTIDSPTITHVFCNAQIYLLSLAVTDAYGISWLVTTSLTLKYVFSDVRVNGAYVDHQHNVLPGTIIHINAGLYNNSSISLLATLTMTLDNGTLLYSHQFNLSQRGSTNATATTPEVSWNTSGWPVKAWRIDVQVINASVAQNVTSDKLLSKYVQLIVPQLLGVFSLSLFQATGLGIIVIVALIIGFARFRKKPSWETEPLTPE